MPSHKYTEESILIQQMSGLVEQATAASIETNQQGRTVPMPGDLCGCINDTHCDRTVSQRSLSVISNFLGDPFGTPNIAIADNIFIELFLDSVQGAVPGTITFNDANNSIQRQKINQLVLFAIRAEVNVVLMDASPIAVGAIDVSNLQERLENLAYQYLHLKVFHTADTSDPWIDATPLSYFAREKGDYVLIPPVKWVNRDPTMQLGFAGAAFGTGAGELPEVVSSVRAFEGTASVSIETLWMPDPNMCDAPSWPNRVCDRNMIANTPQYAGKIDTAKALLSALAK